MNCIIADDEKMSRDILQRFIEKTSFLELTGICTNAIEASNILMNSKPELLFLDIEMPGMSGMELIQTLQNPPQIILTTSYEKYAIEAFEHRVTDYLLKPFSYARFLKAVTKAAENLRQAPVTPPVSDFIYVKKKEYLVKVNMKDILWIEALGDYVTLHTPADKFVIKATMKSIEDKLPLEDFVRAHRSFIVRLDKIESIEDTVIIIGKKLIPIGPSHRTALMKRLKFI